MCINIGVIVISVKNALTDPDLSNPKTTSFPEYPKVILYTKFEHFGIICFWVMLCQTNRQTNKQTEPNILPTPTDSVGVGSNRLDAIANITSIIIPYVDDIYSCNWLKYTQGYHTFSLKIFHDFQ